MKNRRNLIIAVAAIILVATIGVVVFVLSRGPQTVDPDPSPSPTPIEQVNTIPVEQRPYVIIRPDAAQRGRGIVLTIGSLKKPAAIGEYELEYQSGNLLQGAFGLIQVGQLPESYNILLGSCSAGGACTYHEDVTGGSLLLRLDEPERYVLKSDWAFIENTASETAIGSRDAKFRLESAGLARVSHLTITNTPGLPENPDGELLSAGYSVASISPVASSATVSLRLNQQVEQATILAWSGSEWVELETTVEDQVATAEVPRWFEAYVAVGQ